MTSIIKKRLIAISLCFILIIGMIPATSMAADPAGGWIEQNEDIFGLNYDSSKNAEDPYVIRFNGKWYAAWQEKDASGNNQIRVAVQSDTDGTWSFIDGGGASGINANTAKSGASPILAVYGGDLYAIWVESATITLSSGAPEGHQQIRVKKYTGGSTWTFVDAVDSHGGTALHASDYYTASDYQYATSVSVAADSTGLYVAWTERYSSHSDPYQLHIAKYNGSWSVIGGTTTTAGLNYSTAQNADNVSIAADSGTLYVAWREAVSSSVSVLRASCYTGGSWSNISGASGLNCDPAKSISNTTSIVMYNGAPYVAWSEPDAANVNQLRVKTYDKVGGNWNFVDGGGSAGLNHDPSKYALYATLAADSSNLYIIWTEASQYRVASYNAADGWTEMDSDGISAGGDSTGLNMDPQYVSSSSGAAIGTGDGKLCAVFSEGVKDTYIYKVQFKEYDPTFSLPSDGDKYTGLTISTGTLYPNFDPNIYDYTILLDKDTTSLSLKFTLADEDAVVVYNGTKYQSDELITLSGLETGDNDLFVPLVSHKAAIVRHISIRVNRAVSDTQRKISAFADSFYCDGYPYPNGDIWEYAGEVVNWAGYSASYGPNLSVLLFDYSFIAEPILGGQVNITVKAANDARTGEDVYASLYGSDDTAWTINSESPPSHSASPIVNQSPVSTGSNNFDVTSYVTASSERKALFVIEGNEKGDSTDCCFTFYSNENATGKPYLLITYQPLPKLSAPATLSWDATTPGKATWSAVTNAGGYSVQLYKNGSPQGSAQDVAAGTLYYDFTSAITPAGNGVYTFKVITKGDSVSYGNSDTSSASSGYDYNTTPSFVGAATALTVDESSSGNSVKDLLHVSDADSGQTLTWTQKTAPGHGTLTVTGVTASTGSTDITPGGTITYAPSAGYYGSDSFTVQVSDGKASSERTITVTVTAVPDKLAAPTGLAWDATTPGKATWNTVTGASGYSVQLYKGGSVQGSAVSVASGTLYYDFTSTIAAAGNGTYTFKVTAKGDGYDYSDSDASTVSGGYDYNIAPTFVGAVTNLTVDESSGGNSIKAMLHASDPDSGQTLTWTQKTAPSHGTLTITGATASTGAADITPGGTIAYTPASGYYGSDSFTVQVSDGRASVQRTITVMVAAVPDKLATPAGLAWDVTTPGKATWSTVTNASGYSVQLYKNGSNQGSAASVAAGTLYYDFTSAITAAGNGMYTFKVTASGDGYDYSDSDASSASAEYDYNNAPSFAGSDTSLTVDENSSGNSVKALLHASDIDSGQTLTWTEKSAPVHGTLTITGATASTGATDITPGGAITYTPDTGYHGSDSFTVRISDGKAAAERTISVTVTDLPDKLAIPTGLAWDTTTPGKATWSSVTGSSGYSVQLYKNGSVRGGSVSVAAGTLYYDFASTITSAYNGTYTFKVTAKGDGVVYSDSDASSASGGYDYNTAPVFAGGVTALTVNENSSGNSAKALLHASDPDSGQTLTWTKKTDPPHGSLTISGATASTGSMDITPGGTIAYTPTAGYYGNDTFSVQVSDGTDTVTRMISVTVTAVPDVLAAPTGLAWNSAVPGKATWGAVTGAGSYSVQLYRNGSALGSAVSVTTLYYDFTSVIVAAGNASYTFTVTAKGDGYNYSDGTASAPSAGYAYIAPTMAAAAGNNVTASATSVTPGSSITLTAAGDRQNKAGIVSGDERYIPVSWSSTETGKSGSFAESGGKYTSSYTPAVAGTYTVTATFQKQAYNGTSWANMSGSTAATAITIKVLQVYTVRFEDWDGTLLKLQRVTSGNAAAAPADPERTGYTFTGWSEEYSKITEDITVTAEYSVNTFTVSFDTDGGSAVANQTVNFGGNAGKPADPTRGGFSFGGWYADSSLNEAYDFNSKIITDTTVYAKWNVATDTAAKTVQALTLETAFEFAQGDTWECVTINFVMLGSAGGDTQIAWSSSNTNVVRIEQSGGNATGIITRPQTNDASVVITATVTKGGESASKTFLLVVKQQGASKDETREETGRTTTVQTGGDTGAGTAGDPIYRTTLDNGTNIDYITVTENTVQKLVEQGGAADKIVVAINNDADNPADEFAFEVASDTVETLVQNGLGVTLQSPAGTVSLSAEALNQAAQSGTSLYFRIVPVTEEAEEAEEAFRSDGAIFSLGNVTGQVFGTPKAIQTNMEGYATTITLPLEGLSDEQLADEAFLETLCIYVEHDDGKTELVYGTLVYTDDVPAGIQFEISRFSRFQVVSVEKTATTSPWVWIVCCAGGVLLILVILLLVIIQKRRSRERA